MSLSLFLSLIFVELKLSQMIFFLLVVRDERTDGEARTQNAELRKYSTKVTNKNISAGEKFLLQTGKIELFSFGEIDALLLY